MLCRSMDEVVLCRSMDEWCYVDLWMSGVM